MPSTSLDPDLRRVLVIDRNATVRRAVVQSLERVGLVVSSAATPEAFDAPLDGIELAIVDCSRPGPEHWSTLERWWASPELSLLPMTVHPERIPASVRDHALPTLPKPFSPFQLIEIVSAALILDVDNPFSPRATARSTEELIDVDVDLLIDPDVDSIEVGELPVAIQLIDESTMQDLDDVLEGGGTAEHFTPSPSDWGHTEIASDPELAIQTIQPLHPDHGGLAAPPAIPASTGTSRAAAPRSLLPRMEEVVDDADIFWEEELPSVYEPPRPPVELQTEERVEAVSASVESSRPRRHVAEWAVQLATDWEHIGLEADLTRRAELIQTAVIDIESEPGALRPSHVSGQLMAVARPGAVSGAVPAIPAFEPLTFSGDLALLRPAELLRIVRDGHLVGALELSNDEVGYRLTLWGDTLRYLEPRTPNEDLLLGRILLARGQLEPEALTVALAQDDELPLGERLVEVGILNETELHEALRLQARAYFYEICRLSRGHFHFREVKTGTLPRFGQAEPRPINFRVSELLLDLAREQELAGIGVQPLHERDETRLVKQPSAPSSSRPNLRLIETPAELRRPASEDTEEVEDLVERLRVLGLLDPPDPSALDPEDA